MTEAQLTRRGDSQDPRLNDRVHLIDDIPAFCKKAPRDAIAIVGYPDDEGIKLNGGRVGASLAPQEIRKYLYRMTPPVQETRDRDFFDLGDLNIAAMDLAKRHDTVRDVVADVLDAGARLITLGGGHDYGYADGAGFMKWLERSKPGLRPLVVNFDAHLDVRPVDHRGLNSGTPFFRLLTAHPNIDSLEVGIQSQCNSRKHLEWVQQRGAKCLSLEDFWISQESLVANLMKLAESWLIRSRPCWISCDMDVFSSAYAPGCSQSWPTGLDPRAFFEAMEFLMARMDVRQVSLYEVSPPLDIDGRTSRLAAQIAHRFAFSGR
jgi:formiminoglutamase